MARVDSQIPGSLWPMQESAAIAAPQYLPAFLERPCDAAVVPPGLSASQIAVPCVSEAISAIEAAANLVVEELGADRAPADAAAIDGAQTAAESGVLLPAAAPVAAPAMRQPRGANVPLQVGLPLQLRLPLRVRRVEPARVADASGALPLAAADELRDLAAAWNSLARPVPFRSFEWVESWWRHYQMPGWQTYLLKVEDRAGQIVGIAPWYVSRSPVAGRVVQFLGSGEACSEYPAILAQAGHETEVAAALSQWLSDEGARDWDLLLLAAPHAGDRGVAALAEDFADRGHVVHRRPGMPCWRCELPPTWDEFVRQLSKSRRERLRQLTRKYFDTGRVRTRWVSDAAELDAAFATFVDMHQRRRRSLGQPGCYSSQRFADFHAEVSRRLLATGKLRLLWTELDGQPVAAEYDFMDGQTVYYYSTGVEPDATAHHPGWLAMMGSLRRAIDEGCRWFDFLRGDEDYKCSWGAKPLATLETRIVARGGVGRLRHRTWLARQQLRRWAKGVKEWNARRNRPERH